MLIFNAIRMKKKFQILAALYSLNKISFYSSCEYISLADGIFSSDGGNQI